MGRKLLFILNQSEMNDDLEYIRYLYVGLCPEKGSALYYEKIIDEIKVLLLNDSYIKHQINEISNLRKIGVEIVVAVNIFQKRKNNPDNRITVGTLLASGIRVVDQYDYVVEAISGNFELLKW